MTPQEIRDAINADPALVALAAVRNDAAIAADPVFSGQTQLGTQLVTTRGVRALQVLPRSRYALLQVLKDAETTTPAWLIPTLTALGVPAEDHPAYVDDLASAWAALNSFTDGGGLDVGSAAARGMLDIIATAVPDAASACVAVKTLAERPAPVSVSEISKALNEA